MMKLRKEIIRQIRESNEIKGFLMGLLNKRENTIINYLNADGEELTKIGTLNALSKKMGLPVTELIVEGLELAV